MTNEPTLGEILEAIHLYAAKVDEDLVNVDVAIKNTKEEMRRDLRESEARMRDFIDRRITSAVEEIAPTMRKIDEKDSALVEKLEEKQVISVKESSNINSLSPFSAIS